MHRPWSLLRAVLLPLAITSCGNLTSHSACYVLVWNAVVACWPEHEPLPAALEPPPKP